MVDNGFFSGSAATPGSSKLDGISDCIVSSRSVVRSVVLSSFDSISTQPNIGNVDRVGDAFESFWSACWSSVLDVENFIEKSTTGAVFNKVSFSAAGHKIKIPNWWFY